MHGALHVDLVMKRKESAVFLVVFLNVDFLIFVSGYPNQGIRNNSKNLMTIGDWEQSGHNSLLSLLFDRSFSPPEVKGSYGAKELLAKCKNTRGGQRISCVAALIRDLYPDSFRSTNDIGKSTYNERKTTTIKTQSDASNLTSVSVTMVNTLFSKTTSPPSLSAMLKKKTTKTNCKSRDRQKQRQTAQKSEKAEVILMSSAFLIVPGDPKIIMSVIQDADTYVPSNHIRKERITPITCRKDEFGFTEDVDRRIVDIATDMLCSLCKHQRDDVCVIRWCFNII